MLFDYIRIFKEASGLIDMSLDNQDESATIDAAITTSQYIYVAQKLPFTNMFMWIDTANTTTATMSIEYWNGTEWKDAVDVLDGTLSGGKTLARSGNVQFSLAKDHGWQPVWDPTDSNAPAALSTTRIYDCYWIRIAPSATLTTGATLKEVTYAFTATQELKNYDVEIDGYMASFETGKTDWIKEIITASKLLVLDFRRLGLIVHQGQIIELTDVSVPCALKTIMLIYSNLGPSYKDKIDSMKKEYDNAMNIRRFTVDANADGKLERSEMTNTIKRLVR